MNDNKSIPETWQEWQQKIEGDFIEPEYFMGEHMGNAVNTANLAEYIVQCIEDAVQADRTDRQENCEIALRKIVEYMAGKKYVWSYAASGTYTYSFVKEMVDTYSDNIDRIISETVGSLDGGE